MKNKNCPILKKKVIELIKELQISPVDALQTLEPIVDALRRESRKNVEKGVNEFLRVNGLPKIKTDYWWS